MSQNAAPVVPAKELSTPVHNPATGEVLYNVEHASVDEVTAAVARAEKAFESWSQESALKRGRVLFKYMELLDANREELAATLTREHGKTLPDARGEVQRGMEVVEFACGIPHLMKGEYSENVGTGVDCYSIRQPLGVVAGITPFNFPAMIPLWMFPIAVACGNTFILKPSEVDPGVSKILLRLFLEAGAPEGVLQVLNGGKTVVDALLHHPSIQSVSFVGSTPVAEYIHKTASANGKRVQALGGAKNHMVIMPDAPMDQAVEALMGAAYGSAGERCMAISVAVPVGQETADKLVLALKARIADIKIGNGTGKGVDMGPLISQKHLEKVRGYVDHGVTEGAKLVVDGRDFSAPDKKGFFMGCCLFDGVKPGMKIYEEEIFGPVLSVARVKDFNEAVDLINNHSFANGVAIFTSNGGVARQFAHQIKVGMVGINVPIPVPMAFHSFGGWKRSLFGAVHMHGMEGVRFYTRLKAITARWPEALKAEFTMPVAK
ncbi:MAG: CoA-acylating methylmalonate-semialdehyde dehydrogenase [Alphaproteobacteria bacterium]|nr:CoA-acylating methylmalonate-semialdehyde dehydrogenase [Alphaproteobacteria bacterium]